MIAGLAATGLLAVAGPAASADYGFVGKTDQAVMLIDRSTVKDDGRIRSARALIFSRDQRFDPKEAYTILAYQFDCAALASKVDRIVGLRRGRRGDQQRQHRRLGLRGGEARHAGPRSPVHGVPDRGLTPSPRAWACPPPRRWRPRS